MTPAKCVLLIFTAILIYSCSDDSMNKDSEVISDKIKAADISFYPEIREFGSVYYDRDGNEDDLLSILKENGINTIRVRLWVHPEKPHSGLEEVTSFAKEIRNKGLKVWLCVHYSDHWADPGQQECPKDWQGQSFPELKKTFAAYTSEILTEIRPDIIQIGNEINPGFIFPYGNRFEHPNQFLSLLDTATSIVRREMPDTKIMIHYAGIKGALDFYENLKSLDFDIAGLSYYPFWHGKSLDSLKQCITDIHNQNQCDVLIAETAYPFTLGWDDNTNNIIGLEEQILPNVPPTPAGQMQFLQSLVDVESELGKYAIGIAYWAPEWIAYKGKESTSGSAWENQALFDFDHKALPALEILGGDY